MVVCPGNNPLLLSSINPVRLAIANAQLTSAGIGLALTGGAIDVGIPIVGSGPFSFDPAALNTQIPAVFENGFSVINGQYVLIAGSTFYLSSTHPGKMTTTPPAPVFGEIINVIKIAVATSNHTLQVAIAPLTTSDGLTIKNWISSSSLPRLSATATLVANQLTAGDDGLIGEPVYVKNADGFVYKAKANALASASVVGLLSAAQVTELPSPSIVDHGTFVLTTAQWDAITGQSGGLTVGSYYYLSQGTAGHITTLKPDSGIVMKLGLAVSVTTLIVQLGQPF